MRETLSRAIAGSVPLPSTAELQRDLFKVRYLLAALGKAPAGAVEDVDDFVWLRERQRFLRLVLDSRDALRQQRVVELAAWRSAGFAAESKLAHVA